MMYAPTGRAQFKLFDNVLVAELGTAVRGLLDYGTVKSFLAIEMRAASAGGTADVKLEMRVGPREDSLGDYADIADIVSSTALAFPATPEGWHRYSVPEPLGRFIEWKVTGVGANPADTRVDAYLLFTEG